MGSTWHQTFNWNPEAYFDDLKVIALCEAIEANNLTEIDRLVAAGADVKSQGKGKMTPLLWAYPDNRIGRFKRLLELGADPNVVIESDFNTRGGISSGNSVTHLACKTEFPGYFEAVFEHGGDPNLRLNTRTAFDETPLFTVITGRAPDKKAKIRFLLSKGANVNHINGSGTTPVMMAVGWGSQFSLALLLLEGGADPSIYQSNAAQKLTHVVVRRERSLRYATAEQLEDYKALVKWLEDRGESLDEAREDLARWGSWNFASGEFRRNMDAEIAERKAQEAAGEAAAQDDDDAIE